MDSGSNENERSAARQFIGLLAWLSATYLAAAVGAAASVEAGAFYSELVLPAWAPPSWVFGPVWTLLYTLMGVAAWIVWRANGFRQARGALTLYLFHLVPNALWSWLFFSWRLGAAALADILFLLILVIALLVVFRRIRTAAGVLLIPYALWVGFAAVLNYVVWQFNPRLLG